ncbi:hypothetical protein [Glutamicibacter sp. NPDC087344]|uniref:HNH endonuclease n=1 Tax=Glutamicibacter sp. NPDC087344 TaxID=3363994 RepID=UPI00381A3E45
MSWLKQSDIAADHPLVMRILEWKDYDDRLLNEMYGWVNRCATKSAAHDMDYVVPTGIARSMAFGRYEELKAAAVFCGIFFERVIQEEITDDKGNVTGTQPRSVLKLVEEKDLFHMILRSEKEWEAQRQYDNRNSERTGPVRLRDGDECRWCGRITRWDADRRSARMGTIDHLKPGEDVSTDDLVVACKSCNSSRQEGDSWDKKLRSVPSSPYYSVATAKWLFEKCGHRVLATEHRVETEIPVAPVVAGKQKAVESPAQAVEVPAEAVEPPVRGEAPAVVASESGKVAVVESPGAAVTAVQDYRSHSDLLAFPTVAELDDDQQVVSSGSQAPEPGRAVEAAAGPGERLNQSVDVGPAATAVESPAPAVEVPAEAVEPPVRGEAPAESAVRASEDQKAMDPEPGQAMDDSSGQGERLNHVGDQMPTEQRSKPDQMQTTGSSYVRSGFAGSGRDGMGRAGSGRAGHADSGASVSADGSKPSRRRKRPRKRKR